MHTTVNIPTALRQYSENNATVEVDAANILGALNQIIEKHPQLRQQIFAGNGEMRRYINIFLNNKDIRYLEQENTTVEVGDSITLVPAIAGG